MIRPRALVCALAIAVAPVTSAPADDVPAAVLRPLIGLEAGAVVACGFEADLGASDPTTLRLYVGRAVDGPRLVLEIAGPNRKGRTSLRAEVRTGALSTALLQPEPSPGQLYRASAPAGGALAPLFQRLFLAGGTVVLDEDGAERAFVIHGPVPAGIRASFLNCSGDLYRQER